MQDEKTVKWNGKFYGLGDYRSAELNGTDTIILTTVDGTEEAVVFETSTEYLIAVSQLDKLTRTVYDHIDTNTAPRDTGEHLY